MPTYDYRCKSCGHEFEHVQSMSAPHLKKCPSCSKAALERLIGTGAALIFKGGGFYQTDYRSEAYKKSAAAETGGGKPSEGAPKDGAKPAETAAPKTEVKSDSKAEAKPEPTSPKKPAADNAAKPKPKEKKAEG